jgi:hypothetical protein
MIEAGVENPTMIGSGARVQLRGHRPWGASLSLTVLR